MPGADPVGAQEGRAGERELRRDPIGGDEGKLQPDRAVVPAIGLGAAVLGAHQLLLDAHADEAAADLESEALAGVAIVEAHAGAERAAHQRRGERHDRIGQLDLRLDGKEGEHLPAQRGVGSHPGEHLPLVGLRRDRLVVDVAGPGQHAGRLHREARVHLALLQIARGEEGAGADHRQRATRAEGEREGPRPHEKSLGKVSLRPSKTNCMAMAPMMRPITRFITLSPVTPRKREIRVAARSIR